MRKTIAVLFALALSCAWADAETKGVTLSLSNVATSATPDTVTSAPIDGSLECIYLNLTAGATCNVTVATVTNAYSATPAQTLLTQTQLTASAWYYPRAAPVNSTNGAISNAHVPFALWDAPIRVSAHSANATNKDLSVTIIWKK